MPTIIRKYFVCIKHVRFFLENINRLFWIQKAAYLHSGLHFNNNYLTFYNFNYFLLTIQYLFVSFAKKIVDIFLDN